MSIPLVQNNEKDSINTSIIAIKKNLERINSILGLVDSGSDIDTREFVKKSDIVDVVQSGNLQPVTSNAVAGVIQSLDVSKADAVSGDKITSIASLEVTSGMGTKNQYVSSITLPAGSRYLVFFFQTSSISDTARMDGAYVSNAGEFSVVPNSTMGQGEGSVRIAYYKASSNDRVIRYGLGYKYNSTACIFTWRVNAIRLA